jgi:transposase-like protein
MPYQELTALDIRIEMINEYVSKDYTITELSERHGIARKTVYKWLERYQSQGGGWIGGALPCCISSSKCDKRRSSASYPGDETAENQMGA